MDKSKSEYFINNLLFALIILFACFIQISLNFLSFFMISQPYFLTIILFLSVRRLNFQTSSVLIILCGFLYDLMIGGLIGVHSLFFLLLKFFTLNLDFSHIILKKYGEWFLFSFSYVLSLITVKGLFIIVNLKIPDLYAVSFNIGTTLLLFPIILLLTDLPKNIFKLLVNK
tara:strand:- start:174 stop:686 length:513 start_codon:yes stop_codon:yes gene_type:complete